MSQQPPDRPPEGWQARRQPPEHEPSGAVQSFFRRYPLAFLGGILLILVLIATVFGGNDEATDTGSQSPASERTDSQPTTQPEADASTQASCEHFRNIMNDVGQGILNDAELRDKLKEVNDSARVSERADIRAGGVAMLSAITTGTAEDLLKAAGQFDKACDRAGQ